MRFWSKREEKKLGANVTSLSVYQNSLNTTTKERAKPAQLCILMGLYFPKKKLLPCPLFSTKACLSHNGRKILFSTTPARKQFFLLRMFVCVCVCFDIVLLDFVGNLQNTTKKNKKKLISCHARVRLLVLIFPVFKAHTPTTIMYCAAVRSLFPDWCHFCAPYILILLPRAIPQRKKQDKKEQKKNHVFDKNTQNKIKKENTVLLWWILNLRT